MQELLMPINDANSFEDIIMNPRNASRIILKRDHHIHTRAKILPHFSEIGGRALYHRRRRKDRYSEIVL